MGYEKPAYDALDLVAQGKPWKHPGGPGKGGTPNHRLMHAALDYAVLAPTRGTKGERWQKRAEGDMRKRLLTILRSQADPRPGEREGIGVVEGAFEQSPGDHHVVYHALPTLVIALVALRAGDDEVLGLALRVLGRWYAMWRFCALEDGRVVAPGTRRWKFRSQPPPVGEDGLVHEPAFSGKVPFTFNVVGDALYRRLSGFDWCFIDNQGKKRSWAWGKTQDRAGFAAVRAMDGILDSIIPLDLEMALCVPIERSYLDGNRLRLWLTKPREQVAADGYIQGFFPAVEVVVDAAENVARIAWAPNVIPAWWETS